ncbi:hypothetical protein GVK83_10130 [Enterococcus hirae]|uniref:putative HNHc nuclease n=1 Tax=Enterococcus hirae TaxID=1354 RepID=UPI001373360C|nr:hypothetical protein [Enterococcus hirae]NBA34346.1 hypothetical protein [Enterococcus hirae]NBA37148.1 hypothetical protein [Enterococcus hirae]NBA38870.1 hypothetical protein [Enterococcus hirae]
MKVFGKLISVSGNKITLELDDKANIKRISTFSDGAVPTVEVDVKDVRKITAAQRKFIFALCNDCDDWMGIERGYMRQWFRDHFEFYYGYDNFSLSNCSEEEATLFIDLILDFVFKHEVPLPKGIQINLIPKNQQHYFYLCLKYRICCISGQPHAEIAHYNAVGNRKRKKVDHRKLLLMSLSHKYHMEQHQIGIKEFMNKYHVAPIYLDTETVIELGLMTRKQVDEMDSMAHE